MKNIKHLVLVALGILLFVSCDSKTSNAQEVKPTSPKGVEMYQWEADRKGMLDTDDLVLLYSGGAHRSYGNWETELVKSYLSYTDTEGKEHWLFDGFLFLEIFDTVNKLKFATGYNGEAALQKDWKAVLDLYFAQGKCIDALEKEIEVIKTRLGDPVHKHRIVISIPEPISEVSNWGQIDGKTIDFTQGDEQRMEAVKWYINYAREQFDKAGFKNVELAGFYWVAETATHTRSILKQVGEYLNDLNYGFNWIPYWSADGYKDWKSLGYNFAYQQPNHYFNDAIAYSRLEDACKAAIEYNMDMEIEFDESALVEGKNRGSRLTDYMKAFRDFGIIDNKRLAHYQGGLAVHQLKNSTNEGSQKLYHEFCQFVLDHRANMMKIK